LRGLLRRYAAASAWLSDSLVRLVARGPGHHDAGLDRAEIAVWCIAARGSNLARRALARPWRPKPTHAVRVVSGNPVAS
jgi:hypothetical protein